MSTRRRHHWTGDSTDSHTDPPTRRHKAMRHAIARWTPTGDVVRDRFGRLFEDAFNDMLRPFGSDPEGVSNRTWIPRVDIREGADGLTLLMDLPGLGKEDVHITL